MEEIYREMYPQFLCLALLHDIIGWRRFIEGMISKECASIQQGYLIVSRSHLSIKCWSIGLVTSKLLKVTYRQWLYRNTQVHMTLFRGSLYLRRRRDTAGERKNNMSLLKMDYWRRITVYWKWT